MQIKNLSICSPYPGQRYRKVRYKLNKKQIQGQKQRQKYRLRQEQRPRPTLSLSPRPRLRQKSIQFDFLAHIFTSNSSKSTSIDPIPNQFTPKTQIQKEKVKKCLRLVSNKEKRQKKLFTQNIFSNIKDLGKRSRKLLINENEVEGDEEQKKEEKIMRTFGIQQFNKIQIIWFDARAAPNSRIYQELKENLKKFGVSITQKVQVTEQILWQMENNQKTQYIVSFTNRNFRQVVQNQHFPFLNSKHYFMYIGSTDIAQKNVRDYSFQQPVFYTASDSQFQRELILYVKARYKTLRSLNMLVNQ